MIIGT